MHMQLLRESWMKCQDTATDIAATVADADAVAIAVAFNS